VIAMVEIINRRGLHARASAKFSTLANSWEADVTVSKDDYVVRGDSTLDLLMLIAHQGSTIEITASGEQAAEAVDSLVRLVKDRFGERE